MAALICQGLLWLSSHWLELHQLGGCSSDTFVSRHGDVWGGSTTACGGTVSTAISDVVERPYPVLPLLPAVARSVSLVSVSVKVAVPSWQHMVVLEEAGWFCTPGVEFVPSNARSFRDCRKCSLSAMRVSPSRMVT